jgi:hypothetical protein
MRWLNEAIEYKRNNNNMNLLMAVTVLILEK